MPVGRYFPGIRFAHAADLHLDSPFKGLRAAAPDQVADALYAATFKAWDKIVDLCIAEQLDALLDYPPSCKRFGPEWECSPAHGAARAAEAGQPDTREILFDFQEAGE